MCRVRPELAYLNTGTIGATAADTLDQQMDEIVAFGPDLLHISCGAHDLFWRRPDFDVIERTARRVFAQRELVTTARTAGRRPVRVPKHSSTGLPEYPSAEVPDRRRPATAPQAFGSNGMSAGLAEARCELNVLSLIPSVALPKSAPLSLSRSPAG